MDEIKSKVGLDLSTEKSKRIPVATTNGAEVRRRRVRISTKVASTVGEKIAISNRNYSQEQRPRHFDKEEVLDRPKRQYTSFNEERPVNTDYEERYRQKRQEGSAGAVSNNYKNSGRSGANYPQKRKPNNKKTFNKGTKPEPVRYDLEIDENTEIRLNKFLSNAGVCSRREADNLISLGKVSINGEVVKELGKHVTLKDEVKVEDKLVELQRKIYILLNKPKNTVTTSDDPEGRTTVLDVINRKGGNFDERIYPVGRLDRHTTGVLLLTNDGDLAMKLIHPKFEKRKVYQVWLDKPVTVEHMQQIAEGLLLEDGEIHADAISYIKDDDFSQVGIEIHSGRNRIVRRIFEHLGYKVRKLDRVYFAGLTKKNLPRGKWRYLNEDEVRKLRTGQFE